MGVVGTVVVELCGDGRVILGVLGIGGVVERFAVIELREHIVAHDRALAILYVFGVDIALEAGEGSRVRLLQGHQLLLECGEPLGLRSARERELAAEVRGRSRDGDRLGGVDGQIDEAVAERETVDFGRSWGLRLDREPTVAVDFGGIDRDPAAVEIGLLEHEALALGAVDLAVDLESRTVVAGGQRDSDYRRRSGHIGEFHDDGV